MSLPKGKTIRLSPMRKLVCDWLEFGRTMPLVAVERWMHLEPLVTARQQLSQRPSWFAIFLKAFAVVARQQEELRQSYLTFPSARLHQHACNVANLSIARNVNDEDVVFTYLLRDPESKSLSFLDECIRKARSLPVEEVSDYRRQLLLARFPSFLRRFIWWLGLRTSGHMRAKYFGTFGVTGVAALGSASLHLLSPLSTTLTFGVLQDDGSILVRLFYDHRILDGVQPAAALQRLEETLLGQIREELNTVPVELPLRRAG